MGDSGNELGSSPRVELTLATSVTLGCGTKLTLKELLGAVVAAKDVRQELDSMRCGRLSRGDIVELRSGGPPMTVSRLHRARKLVECYWFDLDGRLRKRAFPQIAIWKLEPETGEPERLEKTDDAASEPLAKSKPVPHKDVPEDEIPF